MERPKSTFLVPPFIGEGSKPRDFVCRRIVGRFLEGRIVRADCGHGSLMFILFVAFLRHAAQNSMYGRPVRRQHFAR